MQKTIRNCFRCGRDFEVTGADNSRKRICPACVTRPQNKTGVSLGEALSPREEQVVRLVQDGLLNKEIAFQLRLAEGTVKAYLFRIFQKVGARNRTDLAMRWTQAA